MHHAGHSQLYISASERSHQNEQSENEPLEQPTERGEPEVAGASADAPAAAAAAATAAGVSAVAGDVPVHAVEDPMQTTVCTHFFDLVRWVLPVAVELLRF